MGKISHNESDQEEVVRAGTLSGGRLCWMVGDADDLIYDGLKPGPGGVLGGARVAVRTRLKNIPDPESFTTCPASPQHHELLQRWCGAHGFSVTEQ